MMDGVKIERTISPLVREVWRYRFDGSRGTLHLVSYTREERASTRHRTWDTVAIWSWYHRRGPNSLPSAPPHSDVDTDALAAFRAAISIGVVGR